MSNMNNKNPNLSSAKSIVVETPGVVITVPTNRQVQQPIQQQPIQQNMAVAPQQPNVAPIQQVAGSNQLVEQPKETSLVASSDLSLTTKKESEEFVSSWSTPKNIPKYTPDEIAKLTEEEKQEYRQIAKTPAKYGRHIEIRSCHSFYKISVWDFFPLFLGQLYSLIRVFIAYGDMKRTINFNKKLIRDFISNFVVCIIYGLFLWPLIVCVLAIFYPYMVLSTSDVTYGWQAIQEQGMLGISEYFSRAINPLFDSSHLAVTIVFLIVISMLNTQTIVYFLLFKFHKKYLFELQKNSVRQEAKRVTELSKILRKNVNTISSPETNSNNSETNANLNA